MALIDKIIWQLERHLDQPITTEALARLCAISPYHMNRAFRVATGVTPMAYLRGRRLAAAARALAYGQEDILPIALEAGYGSHEAFTRAFVAHFNETPRQTRARGSLDPLTLQEPLLMSSDQFIDLAAPNVAQMPERRVVGMSIVCSQDKIAEIPPLWAEFSKVLDPQIMDLSATYGICHGTTPEGAFTYLAAAGDIGADLPHGLERFTIPEGRYAVFEYKGHVTDMPRMFHTIWNKAIPDSDLTPRNAPEYELYDSRFDPVSGRGTMVVAIPVE